MIGFAKVAVLGAALSFSAVTAYELPVRKLEAAVGGKYQDRVLPSPDVPLFAKASVGTTGWEVFAGASGKGDRLVVSRGSGRAVTVERRIGPNTSALTRLAPAAIANR